VIEPDGEARARAERLVAFAQQQSVAPGVAGGSHRRRTATVTLVAAAVIGASAATGYFALGADSGDAIAPRASIVAATVEPAPNTPPAATATTAPATTTSASTLATTTPPSTTAPTTAPAATIAFELDLFSPVRWADIEAGVIHLRGEVPDEATVEQMRALTSAISANAVVEYTVYERVARAAVEPWRVRDPDFFTPGSPPSPASTATADLLVALMVQNPALTMEIRAHTDSTGDALSNQTFTQQQVEAIAGYLTSRGVDPGRLQLVGAGGAEPMFTDGTAEAATLNRRVEFVITGLPS
jgi:hypothetical protein